MSQKPIQTTPYLRDERPEFKGRIHHWSEHLAIMPYMRPCESLDAVPEKKESPLEGDPNRITLIKEALPRVHKAPNGTPRIDSLNKVLGWTVPATKEERDEAIKQLTGNAPSGEDE